MSGLSSLSCVVLNIRMEIPDLAGQNIKTNIKIQASSDLPRNLLNIAFE